jgi:hypothetical protein
MVLIGLAGRCLSLPSVIRGESRLLASGISTGVYSCREDWTPRAVSGISSESESRNDPFGVIKSESLRYNGFSYISFANVDYKPAER